MDGMVRYYAPANFPKLWQNIDDLVSAGRLVMSEEVRVDLKEHEDDAYAWVRDREKAIVATDAAVWAEARKVIAANPKLVAVGSTRNRSDPFVIAVAVMRGATVVTGEVGGSATRPKIPFVCGQMKVPCVGLPDVISAEGWVFA